jgi:hypothetical protein
MTDTRMLSLIPTVGTWEATIWGDLSEPDEEGKRKWQRQYRLPIIAWALCVHEHGGPDPFVDAIVLAEGEDPKPLGDFHDPHWGPVLSMRRTDD